MIRDTIKPSSSYYKRKLMALRILLANPKLVLYSQQLFTLTEPFEPSWFDPDGYPLTSQDPHTLRYVNPWMSSSNGWKSLKDVWKWKKDRVVDMSTRPSQDPSIHPMIPRPIPPHQIDMGPPKDYEQKIKLTWIGHSTCLVHMSNQFTILTDPIFSNKASPFQKFGKKEFFGVARYFPPAVSIFDSDSMDSNHNDLPQLPAVIDVCLISHDHYDHLDYSSIEKLVDRVKFWVVPLGIKQWLLDNISRMDPSSIVELKWWDQVTLIRQDVSSAQHEVMLSTTGTPSVADVRGKSSITLTCAPAQHWSSRTPFDRNTRLWCSWAVHACIPSSLSKQDCMNKLGFFFAGDTARPETFPLHRQIGDRLGPFDLAALPIGAYEPRFFMKDSHCDPDEAVQIHHDLRSRKSVAIHWGTFPLANEPYWDPPLRLNQAVRKFQCEFTSDKIDFTAIGHGESIEAVGSDESSDVFQDLGYAKSKQTLQLLLEERLDDEPLVK
jgi:N-acyl-phosphatidylethanolamine-hydrolysing phospholipase D